MTSLDLGIDFGAKRSECRDRDRDSLVQPRRSSCAPERQDGAKSMAILVRRGMNANGSEHKNGKVSLNYYPRHIDHN